MKHHAFVEQEDAIGACELREMDANIAVGDIIVGFTCGCVVVTSARHWHGGVVEIERHDRSFCELSVFLLSCSDNNEA